jgi:hypothetical protein
VTSRLRTLAMMTAAALAATLLPPALSGAVWTASSASPNHIAADRPANYVHLWSQGSDPAGLGGYALRALSSPAVVAATGADGTLRVAAGAFKNAGTLNRAFTLESVGTLPAGVPSATVTLSVLPDAATGRLPVSAATMAAVGSPGGVATEVLGAGVKRQVNLALAKMPGNGTLYTAHVQVDVTWPGYAGTFLRYLVPVTVWDGNGQGGPW